MSARILFLIVLLAAVTSLVSAETGKQPPSNNAAAVAPQSDAGAAQFQAGPNQFVRHVPTTGFEQQSNDLRSSNLCFTMRSYYFERHDGSAPQMVGTSTCTPAKSFYTDRANKTPGKLVPLGMNH